MKNTCIFYNFCRYLVFGSGILILSVIWGLSLCMTQYNGHLLKLSGIAVSERDYRTVYYFLGLYDSGFILEKKQV